jgi:AcrR family transcriptional regulator
MPKIVDHAQRRDEIALAACRVVAGHGFENATIARIAHAAGYTTGMVAHYYDSKQDIIVAALRLTVRRVEERVTRERESGTDLALVLSRALPLDGERLAECAFRMAFQAHVAAGAKLQRLNVWLQGEYSRLISQCIAECWPEWANWRRPLREQVADSAMTFMHGMTGVVVTRARDWPAPRQLAGLRLQLQLLRRWGRSRALH